MTAAQATAKIFITAFTSLSKGQKEAIIKKLLNDKHFIQDLLDAAIVEQRIKEPSRSLNEYLAYRRRKQIK